MACSTQRPCKIHVKNTQKSSCINFIHSHQLRQTWQNNVLQAAQRKFYFGHDDEAGVLT